MEALRKLMKRWRAENIGLLPPESQASVEEVFARHGGRAGNEIIAMYSMLGGMGDLDKELWRLWSLAEIDEDNDEPSPYGVIFSDYCISCWCFRAKEAADGYTHVYIDFFDKNTPPKRVATSLSAFFETYLTDSNAVIFGK